MKGFDRLILFLFYAYIFMLPFENMLEVVWGIDTPFRPYRVLALLIGLLILLSRPWSRLFLYSNDLKLLGVYVFGLIPTTLAWGGGRLMYESFWMTSLQYFIVLWILLLIKNLPFQRRQLFACMNIYGAGVVINCLIMIEAFLFQNVGRQSGWMDNSNFAAFASNVAFTYFFFLWYHRREHTRTLVRILLWLACMTTFAGLVITGSRGALISLLVSVVLIVAYQFQFRRMLARLLVLALPLYLVLQAYDLDRMVNLLPAWNRVVTLAGKEEARTTLWGQGAEAFRDSYFIGLGIEQFKNPDNYRKYVHKTQNVSVASQHGLVLHNDYLTVLFEYGIPAFICFISFYYGIYWRLRIGKKQDPSWFVFIVCFWNMAIFSMFASSFQSHSMWLVYNILALAAYLYAKPTAFAIAAKSSTTS